MSDLIDRQALMKEFADFVRRSNSSDFAPTPTWNDAVSLVGSMPTAQPDVPDINVGDIISRQALLRQIDIDSDGEPGYYGDTWKFIDTIKAMPSAQPNVQDSVKDADCISRQQAIDTAVTFVRRTLLDSKPIDVKMSSDYIFVNLVEPMRKLPTAQPETNCSEFPNNSDTISRQAAIDAVVRVREYHAYDEIEELKALPSVQLEPAIPLQWIEGQIEWLKSLDNAFSTLTAGQISAMVNKWKDEQDE